MPATPKIYNQQNFEISLAIDVFWQLLKDHHEDEEIAINYRKSYNKFLHQLALSEIPLFEFDQALCDDLSEYIELIKEDKLNDDIYIAGAVKQALVLKRMMGFKEKLSPMPFCLRQIVEKYDYKLLAKGIAYIADQFDKEHTIVNVSKSATETIKNKITYLEMENNIEKKLVSLKASKITLQALMRRTYTKAQFKQLHGDSEHRKGRPNVLYSDAEAELITSQLNMILEHFMTMDTREKIIYICRRASITVEVLKHFVINNIHSNLLSKQERWLIEEIYKAIEIEKG